LLLGGSTYTLYLSHTLWLHFIYRVGWRDWLQQHDYIIAGYWLASLIIIALSVIYYQYAERPFHRGFRRVLGV
jgi:peptidoglycan/LPS O-acetylase OafA/YrhL